MDSIYDIQQLLKSFGIYIYTGNRLGDLELMSLELKELFDLGLIQIDDYLTSNMLLKKEIRNIQLKKDEL